MPKNLLNKDGEVFYLGRIFDENLAATYFSNLLQEVPWQNDKVKIFGKTIITSRKFAWFGDSNFTYRYSGFDRQALSWCNSLKIIKKQVEEICQEPFNSCLANLYHNGLESMGWHSDNEKEIVANSTIASLSLGAERRFLFKHKIEKNLISLNLEDGSLLLMKGQTQEKWLHSLPKMAKIQQPRINLTFRKIDFTRS